MREISGNEWKVRGGSVYRKFVETELENFKERRGWPLAKFSAALLALLPRPVASKQIIATTIGVSYPTVLRWFKDRDFIAELKRLFKKYAEYAQTQRVALEEKPVTARKPSVLREMASMAESLGVMKNVIAEFEQWAEPYLKPIDGSDREVVMRDLAIMAREMKMLSERIVTMQQRIIVPKEAE